MKINFNIFFCISRLLFPKGFQIKILYVFLFSFPSDQITCHSIETPLKKLPNNNAWVKITNIVTMQVSPNIPALCVLFPNILPLFQRNWPFKHSMEDMKCPFFAFPPRQIHPVFFIHCIGLLWNWPVCYSTHNFHPLREHLSRNQVQRKWVLEEWSYKLKEDQVLWI